MIVNRKISTDPFLIPKSVSDTIYHDLLDILSDRKKFNQSLLKLLSKPKNETFEVVELNDSEILSKFKRSKLKRNIWTKITSIQMNKHLYQISINQKLYLLKEADYHIFKEYFEKSPFVSFKIKPIHLNNPALRFIFIECFKVGVFCLGNVHKL